MRARDQPERDFPDVRDKTRDRVMGWSRMSGRRHESGGSHLIDQRLEVRSQIAHLDGVAASCQIVLGSQQ